jgi:hypothetical protein
MSFFSKGAELIGNALNYVGGTVSNVVTGAANAISTAAHSAYETTSNITSAISEYVKPVPVLSGLTDAAKAVVDGTVHGAEIVVEHFDMWAAEAGQAVGTVVSTTGDVITSAGNFDIEGIFSSIKDGVGTIVQKDIQFLEHHFNHDFEILQIPGQVIGNSINSILKDLIGDNDISNAPKMIDTVQHSILETGLHEGIINPILESATKISESIFGDDLVSTLTPEDMGMGTSHHHAAHAFEIQLIGDTVQTSELELVG